MPGIITHNRVLLESMKFLRRKEKRHYISRSVSTLLGDPEFFKSAQFGSLGPNIFDYIPFIKKSPFGSMLSFIVHDSAYLDLTLNMINRVFNNGDYNNEWAANQRAYLYGYISHLVADAVFHPFVFYWSGFAGERSASERKQSREQNLLFEYNMDVFFLTYYREEEKYRFRLEGVLPRKKGKYRMELNPPVRQMILGSLLECCPEMRTRIMLNRFRKNNMDRGVSFVDLVPYCMKLAYYIKRNRNMRLAAFINRIKRYRFVSSDFLIQYPEARQLNRHVLNLHRARWLNPAGAAGYHYESVEDLMKIASEKIVSIWERLELRLMQNLRKYDDILSDLNINPLTGTAEKKYTDLKIAEPFKLQF